MKKEKGQFGYRNSNRLLRLFWVLLFAAAILAQLAARQFTQNQSAKNILTVMAILTVLPMANLASPLLASWKYQTPPLSFYEKIQPYEKKCVILYDLIVTTKDAVLPMDAVAVHQKGVFAYCSKPTDISKAEKEINQIFINNKLDPNVKIIKEEHGFLRRLDSLKPTEPSEDDGTVYAAANLMKNLSM